jgi:hypothetical protein
VDLTRCHKRVADRGGLDYFVGLQWTQNCVCQLQPSSRHFALNGMRIRIICRGHEVPTMRGVMRARFVLVDCRNGHDLSPRESLNEESDPVVKEASVQN